MGPGQGFAIMQMFTTILFWVGIVALVDGSCGLLFEDRWQKLVRHVNIRKVALVEVAVAWILIAVHFLLRT
jgi:hypothetical protein